MSIFKSAVENQKAQVAYTAKNAKRLRDLCKAHHVEKLVSSLVAIEPAVTMYVGMYSVGITVPVQSMKHMLEVLEFAEKVTGIEFDSSEDSAATGQRNFTNSTYQHNWLRITAQVALSPEEQENSLCRRVKVGVKMEEVPIYELECLDGREE